MPSKSSRAGRFATLRGLVLPWSLCLSAAAEAPVGLDGELAALTESGKSVIGVSAGRIATVGWTSPLGASLRISVPIGDGEYTLELERGSVRSPDFQLWVQLADGSLVAVDADPPRTFRGRLAELEGSVVAGSLLDDGLRAVFQLPDGSRYWMEPLVGRVDGAAASQHLIYREEDALGGHAGCGVEEDSASADPTSDAVDTQIEGSGLVFVAQLAIDADYEYFLDYGTVSATQAQIESIINTTNVQYERDIGVRNLIGTMIVRTAEPDPYFQTSAGGLLNRFRDWWVAFHANVPRDAAQLFTGQNLDGAVGGIAFANSLCFPETAFCLVESNNGGCANFACKTDLSAHELGHVWSANHCPCPGWTMNATITSGNRFHPEFDIPGMISFRNSRTCLSMLDECSGLGTLDCNENDVADPCDVSSGISADVDANGGPDECQAPSMPTAGSAPVNKNRAITLYVPASAIVPPGSLTALRVRLTDLQHPSPPNPGSWPAPDYSAYELGPSCTDPAGCVRWVGPPRMVWESQDRHELGAFKAAELQCEPYYHDWVGEGWFDLFGAEIVPSSVIDIENLRALCAGQEARCTFVSAPMPFYTARHGDVTEPFDPPEWGAQPDALDVTVMVNKFRGAPGSLGKSLIQLQPNVLDLNADVNGVDIAVGVDAFRRRAYPYLGPCPCPSAVTCGAVPCESASACGGGTCMRTCIGGSDDGQSCHNDSHCPGGACGAGSCRDACGRCRP